MAERGFKLNQETFSCCICLDLLKKPVTIPCGHSYCMNCVNTHWDGEVDKPSYSCPQCRHNFAWRPILVKNTMLAAVMEELNNSKAAADLCSAAHGDVSCDLCSGRKMKAVKSCLQCLVSYCKEHLQPHYDVAVLKKHKLVEPTENLQENICPRHDEVMKMFCHTDQQCICYLCSVDQHKGHHTVLAVEKRNEMQGELEDSINKVRQIIQDRQKHMDTLQTQTDEVIRSGNAAVDDTDRVFTLIAQLMERRRTEVKQQIRSQQESEEHRVKELQDKVQQEITELKSKYKGLETLSHTEDHSGFILTFPSLAKLSESSYVFISDTAPLSFSDAITAAVVELRDALQDTSTLQQAAADQETHTNVPEENVHSALGLGQWLTLPQFDALFQSQLMIEMSLRAELLAYAQRVTLDPNTAHSLLAVSADSNSVRYMNADQEHPDHPDRFTDFSQVLSREALTGRCYLEVKGRCEEFFSVVVAYKDIRRKGPFNQCSFGNNPKSWALDCYNDGYVFWFNKISTTVTAPPSNKVGIYVDYDAGILSFYSISHEVSLIHTVQTTFTQPLLAGIWLKDVADCAEICSLR